MGRKYSRFTSLNMNVHNENYNAAALSRHTQLEKNEELTIRSEHGGRSKRMTGSGPAVVLSLVDMWAWTDATCTVVCLSCHASI